MHIIKIKYNFFQVRFPIIVLFPHSTANFAQNIFILKKSHQATLQPFKYG